MKLIAKKYRKLKPTIEYLSDEVVIAQAWKKTHAYMRHHNWYADTLALDVSALILESNASSWGHAIKEKDLTLYPMELVPAPKGDSWVVHNKRGWIPKDLLEDNHETKEKRKSKPPLRPLAHLKVRDQTWATAAMLCMADAIETAQGDCSEVDFALAQERKVYSYGNRLLCDWNKSNEAWFRWGNGETYRKFFTDYQSFLKRPVSIGKAMVDNQLAANNVFVVSLDLTKFYDHIDRKSLLNRLKELTCVHQPCVEFWTQVEKLMSWHWDDSSKKTATALGLNIGDESTGLPQGLVSAGFFANAYLVDFDREMGKGIGQLISDSPQVCVHDYCRYVDDLRIVVSIQDGGATQDLGEIVHDWALAKLKQFAGEKMQFNKAKTSVTALSDLDNTGSLSARISQLQHDLSGPADRDILESSMGTLEGLLTLQPNELNEVSDSVPDQALIKLAMFDHDVRPDTLKRFAANRLESIMRNKRRINIEEVSDTTNPQQSLLDNESELLAKKLIWAWMQDPSLALVLRKAIEIYPSPEIAKPAFESIYARCSFAEKTLEKDEITEAMFDYLLADFFRSCVDFQGYFQRIDYPASADPDGVLSLACHFAQQALKNSELPIFVESQALLLLAVMNQPLNVAKVDLSLQHSLHAILAARPIPLQRQRLALYEVASQITEDADSIAQALIENLLKSEDKQLISNLLDDLAKRGGLFWTTIWEHLKRSRVDEEIVEQLEWAAPVKDADLQSGKQRLSELIASAENGFIHEAALIKLALALINLAEIEDVFDASPTQLYIEQTQNPQIAWIDAWKESVDLKCSLTKSHVVEDPRFSLPSWLDGSNEDVLIIYWIGNILRSAVIGGNDFTGTRWKKGSVSGYKGLRTGWYKRRMGMMHAPEALVGEYATISNWTAELLMTCLQWPGFESSHVQHSDLRLIDGLKNLKRALEARVTKLNLSCCKASDMPTLITKVKRPVADDERRFRLVTVQQLLPKTDDFAGDVKLDNPLTRARHRDHLSSICQLTYKTLTAKLQAEKSDSKVGADLIVFAEVAVHPDDQDLIRRLADKTKAIILVGLIFSDHEGKVVNIARWFIPDYRSTGRQWIIRDQGKAFMTTIEETLGVSGYRPCQHILELDGYLDGPFRISGAICYDATDLKLAADLKDKTDLFVVPAHNKDVNTFDTMVSALNYHMYQHVAVINKGEFGGSTIQAPFKESYDRMISHSHGARQISINVADLDLAAFTREHNKDLKGVKRKPAG